MRCLHCNLRKKKFLLLGSSVRLHCFKLSHSLLISFFFLLYLFCFVSAHSICAQQQLFFSSLSIHSRSLIHVCIVSDSLYISSFLTRYSLLYGHDEKEKLFFYFNFIHLLIYSFMLIVLFVSNFF